MILYHNFRLVFPWSHRGHGVRHRLKMNERNLTHLKSPRESRSLGWKSWWMIVRKVTGIRHATLGSSGTARVSGKLTVTVHGQDSVGCNPGGFRGTDHNRSAVPNGQGGGGPERPSASQLSCGPLRSEIFFTCYGRSKRVLSGPILFFFFSFSFSESSLSFATRCQIATRGC